jgi:RecJ-like exonuclease
VAEAKPFWTPLGELEALGYGPLTFSFPKDLDKTRSCPNFDMTGKCTMGQSCKFAHGKDELKILDLCLRDKYKCHNRVLTNCQKKREVCMYWHEEEADFSLKS